MGLRDKYMKMYELVDVFPLNDNITLGDDWAYRIGRKGYFVGEVDVDLCLMFSYRLQKNFWGFITAPVRSIEGKHGETDLIVKTDNVQYAFMLVETHED